MRVYVFTICSLLVAVCEESCANFGTDGVYRRQLIVFPSSATHVERRLEYAELGCVDWPYLSIVTGQNVPRARQCYKVRSVMLETW